MSSNCHAAAQALLEAFQLYLSGDTAAQPTRAARAYISTARAASSSREPVVAMSENGGKVAIILGNPAMVAAYRSGIPDNGKPFPDGARMAKIHWLPKTQQRQPGQPKVPGTLHDVDFMVKDSKRFPDSGGWGWAVFEYEAASDTFRPGNSTDSPPQGHDAKCGFACHTLVKNRDFVFTEYPKR